MRTLQGTARPIFQLENATAQTQVKLELEELKPRMLGVGLDSTEETSGGISMAFGGCVSHKCLLLFFVLCSRGGWGGGG